MIDRLRSLAGADGVRRGEVADAVHDAVPAVVVTPADAAACAAVLAACSENDWSVEIAGRRSARRSGRPPSRVDVLLSTARIRGVAEYEPADLTIGVAGGTPVGELRTRVATSNQRLPLDPPEEDASIGGVLARGASGPMRRAWGTPRRQVLGIQLVTGDGRVLSVGGRVVKNVAGYDLNKLIVGSAGTLGVITRAHLRLLPAPVSSAVLVLAGAPRDDLFAAARQLLEDPVQPAALELTGPPWRLIILYEGAVDVVSAGSEVAERVAARVSASFAHEDDALARLASAESNARVLVRAAHLPSRLPETIAVAEAVAGPGGTIAAHVGEGIARAMPEDGAQAATVAQAIEDARARMEGGTVIIERGPSELLRLAHPWGEMSEATLRLTRELKRQFDPAGILQRGRWLA